MVESGKSFRWSEKASLERWHLNRPLHFEETAMPRSGGGGRCGTTPGRSSSNCSGWNEFGMFEEPVPGICQA